MILDEKIYSSVTFDHSPIKAQLSFLVEVIPSGLLSEGLRKDLFCSLSGLFDDIVFGDGVTTVAADGTNEVVYRLWFGESFEVLVRALRAGEFRV